MACAFKDLLIDALACIGKNTRVDLRLYSYFIQHWHLTIVDKVRGVSPEPFIEPDDGKGCSFFYKTSYKIAYIKHLIEILPNDDKVVDVVFIDKSLGILRDGRPIGNISTLYQLTRTYR